MSRTSQSHSPAGGPGGRAARALLALALLAAAPAGCGSCQCGGHGGDAAADGGGGKLDSATGTDAAPADAGPVLTQCERICALADSCGIPGIGGAACGGFCARADDGVLACLDAAATASDCTAAANCILMAPPPPECDPLCTFGDGCIGVPGLCDATCAVVNDEVRMCAMTAEASMDCTLFAACFLDPMTATTCSDVCTFAVETCGQAIPFGTLGCAAACGTGLIPMVIVGCYQVAAFLGSCDAANVCGGLIGIPPPGSDAGVSGTDAAPPGTDAAPVLDAGGTDAACDGGPGGGC